MSVRASTRESPGGVTDPPGQLPTQKKRSSGNFERREGYGIEVIDDEPIPQGDPVADIWQKLQAAQRKAAQEYLNPHEEKFKRSAVRATPLSKDNAAWRSLTGSPLLVVFTKSGCKRSEEALREAQIAQGMVAKFGGATRIANLGTDKEEDFALSLGVKDVPCLRMYKSGNVGSNNYVIYNGADMAAAEIAHWVLSQEEAKIRYTADAEMPSRESDAEASAAGPVVRASIYAGSANAQLLNQLMKAPDSLPSPFTLFKISYVDSLDKEAFRVYRQQQPFSIGEEEYLTPDSLIWDEGAIMQLLLKAEDRKIFFGEPPSSVLVGARALLSVYVSHYQNLQDIALLLMEFQPQYKDRIAFHIANRTLKTAARSANIFSHSWGGAVLTSAEANTEAYQRSTGVSREAVPFSQYSLSMPFNYHNMKDFFEEWASGKRELHFRSNRYSYTEKGSPILELNHAQFMRLLRKKKRKPLVVLYYKSDCPACKEFLKAFKAVATVFAEEQDLKGQMLFGQINGSLNDLIDFDMITKIPAVVMYPPGPGALDTRVVYSGPPMQELVGNFVQKHRPAHDEL
ncbi:hypothetical protein ACSSS7_006593 [Eimeria intestinalis]